MTRKPKTPKLRKVVVSDPEPEPPKPKVRRVRKVRKVKVKPAAEPAHKPRTKTDPMGLFQVDPWKLDSARVFHYGNALRWFMELGVKQVGINPDLSVEVHTSRGEVVTIPAIILVTRDRRYSFNYIRYKVIGKDTTDLVWEMDQYDREFGQLTRKWKAEA